MQEKDFTIFVDPGHPILSSEPDELSPTGIHVVATQVQVSAKEDSFSSDLNKLDIELSDIQKSSDEFQSFTIKSSRPLDQYVKISIEHATEILGKVLKDRTEYPVNIVADAQTALERLERKAYKFKPEIEKTLNRLQGLASADKLLGTPEDTGNPDVSGIVPSTDDPAIPVSTFRVWFIGLWFSIIGSCINNFFAERLPGIGISGFVAQLVAYPMGKLFERVLPTTKFVTFGAEWSFNPGPFSAKEHILITIMTSVSFGSAYATSVIITQRLPMFYDQQWASNWWYQILLVMSSQILGYGLAGFSRRFLVYPAAAVWPGVLPVIALNKSFHEDTNEPADGWKISRMKWFSWLFLCSGLYFFIPNYLFSSISLFNWPTWIAPSSAILAGITGSVNGLGINPFPTLDYNIVSGIVDPLITPWFATLNVIAGMLIMGVLFLPAIWFSNAWFTSYMPIVSNRPYDQYGQKYQVSNILTTDGRLDIAAYEKYSPVYLSAANAMTFGGYFALYPATVVYAYLYHGTDIANAFKNIFGKGKKLKRDVHMQLMEAYKEVPEWWYLSVMGLGFLMAVIMIRSFPTDMPLWGIFFALFLGIIFIIPIGLISAVSNVEIGLNVLSEMVAGFAIPGKPLAMMIFKTYGTITLGQGLSFAADLKLGHYAKIPPRIMFTAQMVATILSASITLIVTNWQIAHIDGFCTQDQKQKFSCPGANTFFTSSVIWGVIGPKHTYGSGGIYHVLLWGFLIGLFIPLPFYYAAKRWPSSWARHVHPPILLAGFILWAPANLSYITAAIPVAYIFNVYIKTRFYAWWVKYNYVTATGLSTGIAIAGLLAFVALQNPGINVDWIGNHISTDGCDQRGCPLISLADGAHFGPSVGSFTYTR